jgi:pimeloyl-ACP methyl ester carboxylesterase
MWSEATSSSPHSKPFRLVATFWQHLNEDSAHRGRPAGSGDTHRLPRSASVSVGGVTLNHIRRGSGRPLLLVHGLGAGWQSWTPILDELAEHREVIAVDLPGFGETTPLTGEVSIARLTDSVPGGFWNRRELFVFGATLRPSIALVRALRGRLPALLGSSVGRTLLLAQLSARPWALSQDTVLPDVRGLADSPATGAALNALTKGPKQQGAPAGTVPGRVTIGWGRRDLVTVPRQAARAAELFPDAVLHWFERCGHFPQWDAPVEATQLILDSTN